MAFPRVSDRSVDVPVGPTGHLKSGAKGTKLGGSRSPASGGKGLTNSQMKVPVGKGRSMSGGR